MVSFTIDGQLHQVGAGVVTIGRDPACTIAIANSRLHSLHARIRAVRKRLIIEACTPDRLHLADGRVVPCVWLHAGARVRLTENGPELRMAANDFAQITSRQMGWRGTLKALIPSHAGLACLLTLAGGVLALGLGLSTLAALADHPMAAKQTYRATVPVADLSQAPAAVEQPECAPVPVEPDEEASSTTNEVPVRTSMPGNDQPDVIASLYVVLLRLPNSDKTYRLGTAFAVGPRQLVSSAAIASALQTHQTSGTETLVQNALTQNRWRIVDMSVPEEYLNACRQIEAARQCEATEASQVESNGEPANRGEQKKAQAEESLLRSFESQAFFDAAMIHVESDLPAYLEIEDASSSSVVTATNLTLVGLPFPTSQFAVRDDQVPAMQQVAGTIIARSASATAQAHGLLLKSSRIAAGDNWCGSPVIDYSGRVVGVYSQPAPTTAQGNDSDSVSLHYLANLSAVCALVQ